MQHTEGPWEFGETEFHTTGRQQEIVGPDGECIGWIECYQGDPSNAHLAKAAPDLLDACQELLDLALECGFIDQTGAYNLRCTSGGLIHREDMVKYTAAIRAGKNAIAEATGQGSETG